MERRAYALALAYCGEGFAGWQRQDDRMLRPPASARQPAKPASSGRPTVQAAVEAALEQIGLEVAISAAARTDAGVHARRQLVTFRARRELPCPAILAELNRQLPRSVRALGLRPVGSSFHARASPHLREYRYRVLLDGAPARFAWSLPDAQNVPALPERFDADAARVFLATLTGRRDRSPHTTRPDGPKLTSLTLAELDDRSEDRLRFTFQGDGFTRHLVRNWVWAAVAHGCGIRAAHESPSGWRGPTAPGRGLILWDLVYPDEPTLFERAR
jgi:tRNA pseudouridine38-40 synthase